MKRTSIRKRLLQYEGLTPQVQVLGFNAGLLSPKRTFYAPIHDVAPSAVTMAVATDAII